MIDFAYIVLFFVIGMSYGISITVSSDEDEVVTKKPEQVNYNTSLD